MRPEAFEVCRSSEVTLNLFVLPEPNISAHTVSCGSFHSRECWDERVNNMNTPGNAVSQELLQLSSGDVFEACDNHNAS